MPGGDAYGCETKRIIRHTVRQMKKRCTKTHTARSVAPFQQHPSDPMPTDGQKNRFRSGELEGKPMGPIRTARKIPKQPCQRRDSMWCVAKSIQNAPRQRPDSMLCAAKRIDRASYQKTDSTFWAPERLQQAPCLKEDSTFSTLYIKGQKKKVSAAPESIL